MDFKSFYHWLFDVAWPSLSKLIGLSTILGLIGIWFRILEARKNRTQNILPEIIISKPLNNYHFRWIPSQDLQPIIEPMYLKGKEIAHESRLPAFVLKNIGIGAAKNIKITWNIMGDNLKNIVTNSDILKKYNPLINQRIFGLKHNAKQWEATYSDQADSFIDYTAATQSTDFREEIIMPFQIESSYGIRAATLTRLESIDFLKLPKIKLAVTYNDIKGKKYQKYFLITSSLMFIPDNVSSDSNTVENKYFSFDNIRGIISFNIKEIKH